LTDKIILRGITVWGYHGVMEAERALGQPFMVDVEMLLSLQVAAREDDLAQTVDYGEVVQTITRVVSGTSCRLLESLAEAIAQRLLAQHGIRQIRVTVKKPRVPLPVPMEYAAVEVCRTRDDYGLSEPGEQPR
jgi:dihydroneopterin aldolase